MSPETDLSSICSFSTSLILVPSIDLMSSSFLLGFFYSGIIFSLVMISFTLSIKLSLKLNRIYLTKMKYRETIKDGNVTFPNEFYFDRSSMNPDDRSVLSTCEVPQLNILPIAEFDL